MPGPSQAAVDDGGIDRILRSSAGAMAHGVDLAIYDNLDAVEGIWRQFERRADCTAFQTFDWLAAWQRHIGRPGKIKPAIIVGRRKGGDPLFLMPLAVVPGLVCRLSWLGSDLCDYNAPLIARDFYHYIPAADFPVLWDEIRKTVENRLSCRLDVVELTKMPETIGTQPNPMLTLDVAPNPSGAHLAKLSGSWDQFYQAKRSAASRRHDRNSRKRMSLFGEVRLIIPQQPAELTSTLETLFAQKAKLLARIGVYDIFRRPGYREFFLDIALNPAARDLVHVSRLDIGPIAAAANLGLVFRGTYYHVLASYDGSELSRFGPGTAHLCELLRHAIDLGCQCFDFTIGDEPYKLKWSDQTLNLYDHTAAATARGWPRAAVMVAGSRAKRAIKRDPRLWHAFTRLRSAVARRSLGDGSNAHGKTRESGC